MRRGNGLQLTANHQGQLFQVALVLVQVVLAGGARQCMSTRYFALINTQCMIEHQLVTPASVGCTTRICTREEAIQVWKNQSLALLLVLSQVMMSAQLKS